MPIAEFTRAFYAMNRVLEDASYKVRLSKRAAGVLLILFETDDGRMKTADLVVLPQLEVERAFDR